MNKLFLGLFLVFLTKPVFSSERVASSHTFEGVTVTASAASAVPSTRLLNLKKVFTIYSTTATDRVVLYSTSSVVAFTTANGGVLFSSGTLKLEFNHLGPTVTYYFTVPTGNNPAVVHAHTSYYE